MSSIRVYTQIPMTTDQKVGGSNPPGCTNDAPVVQLDRIPDFGSGG